MGAITDYLMSLGVNFDKAKKSNGWCFRLNTIMVHIKTSPNLSVWASGFVPDCVFVGPFKFQIPDDFYMLLYCDEISFETEDQVVESLRALADFPVG